MRSVSDLERDVRGAELLRFVHRACRSASSGYLRSAQLQKGEYRRAEMFPLFLCFGPFTFRIVLRTVIFLVRRFIRAIIIIICLDFLRLAFIIAYLEGHRLAGER